MKLTLKAGRYQDSAPEHMDRTLNVLKALDGRNGFVFSVISVEGKRTEPRELLNLVREHTERLADTFGKDANPQHRFEQFLRGLNEQVATEIREGHVDLPLDQFHALVGIACEERMYLSGTGDLTALFLHRKPQNRYQVYNLFRSIQTEQALPTWEKAFAVVLDGDLHPGDVFCAANQDLQRAIQPEELNAILATLPPPGALEKIRQYFPHNANLSMLVLQAHAEESVTVVQPTDVSVQQMVHTHTETQRMLEDQRPRLAPFLALLKRMKSNSFSSTGLPRSLGIRVLNTGRALGVTLAKAGAWAAAHGKTLTKQKHRPAAASIPLQTRAKDAALEVASRLNQLPTQTKYLGVASIGVLVLLGGSIFILSQAQNRSTEENTYTTQVTEIEERTGQADGAIIYKDEERARTLYTQALALVEDLPKDTPERTATADRLRKEILSGLDELRHVVTLPDPPLLADINTVAPGVSGKALFRLNGDVHVFGSDKSIYRVDVTQKSAVRIETTLGEVGVPLETSEEDGSVYFLDDRPGVSLFDTENNTLQVTGVAPAADRSWKDVISYGGKLYLLQPSGADTQIVRFLRAGGGFDGGTDWIRSKSTDLSDAISFAIDATIFVLKSNGKIVRFTSGSEVGWDNEAVDPAVTQATDIWTDADSKYVYVLEPSTQRLLVYAKDDGHFIVQYRSDAWSGLTDFLVDEENKTVYLLAGSKVYAIQTSNL